MVVKGVGLEADIVKWRLLVCESAVLAVCVPSSLSASTTERRESQKSLQNHQDDSEPVSESNFKRLQQTAKIFQMTRPPASPSSHLPQAARKDERKQQEGFRQDGAKILETLEARKKH